MLRRRAMVIVVTSALLAPGGATSAFAAQRAEAGIHGAGTASSFARGAFAPGSGQPIVDWNKTLISILSTPGAQPPTVHPTRSFAILQAAEYDAVVSITKVGHPYLFRVHVHGRA